MNYTDTEEYILSNLPNGSDIAEDVQEFGIAVVDALAEKIYRDASRLRSSVQTDGLDCETEGKALRHLIGHTLNLQRMKRHALVKELFGI